jgi:hypothetical protein
MRKNIQILAALAFIEGMIAFAWLAFFPTDHASGLFGFSPFRLISLIGILVVLLGCLAVFVYSQSGKNLVKTIQRIVDLNAGIPLSFLCISICLAIWVSILFKEEWLLRIGEAAYDRLLPITLWISLLCLQMGWLLLLPSLNKHTLPYSHRSIWNRTLVLLGGFLAVWILISVSRIGFVHDTVGLSWGPPGTPISFAQVNLVFALSLVLVFAVYLIRSKIPEIYSYWLSYQDIIIFTGLWALAVVLWWNQPMSPTHFAPAPMAPNNEYYPNSDAAIFDKSSYHLINGSGFSNHLARRPLYVGMLGLFHKIAGPGYEDTVFLQILVLALIPSLIYLLTSKLSNRLAGLIAGGMILLREKNAIELSGEIVTSHAKLMMSDLVATLGVIVITYLCVQLLMKQDRDHWTLAIIGACVGLTALVRAQVLVLVPLLFIYIIIARRSIKLGMRESILIFLGLALTLAPWVWRNWNLTGSIVLDDGGELRLLARNYSSDPVNHPEQLTGESQKEFSARLTQGILGFVTEHPRDVLFFVSNHFFHNLATSAVYIAPVYSTNSPHSLVGELPFWGEWNGQLTSVTGVILFINLVIVVLGVGIAQERHKLAGWLPMIVFLVYSMGNAIVRSSGWRFSLPVDWVIVMYYGTALAYIPSVIKYLLADKNRSSQSIAQTSPGSRNPFMGITVFSLMLLLGASIPVAERLIPARDFANYTEDARKSLMQEGVPTSSEVETFLKQENAVFVSGLALYPRYIRPNSRFQLADINAQFRYLHFWIINEDDDQIVFPLQNPPDIFQHASTISVLGCKEDNYISARAIVMHAPSKRILVDDPQLPLSCP